MPAVGSDNWFLSWLTVLKLLTQGSQLIQEGYDKVRGLYLRLLKLNLN